jgi:hypothetical protein
MEENNRACRVEKTARAERVRMRDTNLTESKKVGTLISKGEKCLVQFPSEDGLIRSYSMDGLKERIASGELEIRGELAWK